MACGRPLGASRITRGTPRRPPATHARPKAVPKAASALHPMSKPHISRSPDGDTPVAMTQALRCTRSPSRTCQDWASSQTSGDDPASTRSRNFCTRSSNPWHRAETVDGLIPVMPQAGTPGSPCRGLTPATDASGITATHAGSRRRRGSQKSGKSEPFRSFGMSRGPGPRRVSQVRSRWPLRAFVRSAVRSYRPAPIGSVTWAAMSGGSSHSSDARRQSTSSTPTWRHSSKNGTVD
jgi:hypothetical protein